jgi:hypothetical protein
MGGEQRQDVLGVNVPETRYPDPVLTLSRATAHDSSDRAGSNEHVRACYRQRAGA